MAADVSRHINTVTFHIFHANWPDLATSTIKAGVWFDILDDWKGINVEQSSTSNTDDIVPCLVIVRLWWRQQHRRTTTGRDTRQGVSEHFPCPPDHVIFRPRGIWKVLGCTCTQTEVVENIARNTDSRNMKCIEHVFAKYNLPKYNDGQRKNLTLCNLLPARPATTVLRRVSCDNDENAPRQ